MYGSSLLPVVSLFPDIRGLGRFMDCQSKSGATLNYFSEPALVNNCFVLIANPDPRPDVPQY